MPMSFGGPTIKVSVGATSENLYNKVDSHPSSKGNHKSYYTNKSGTIHDKDAIKAELQLDSEDENP